MSTLLSTRMGRHLIVVARLSLSMLIATSAQAGMLGQVFGNSPSTQKNELLKMNDEIDTNKLAFTCTHEADHLPPLDPEADKVFKYARYLETRDGPKDYDEIGKLYRRAAKMGHYKAMRNLQSLLYEGMVSSPRPGGEAVDLVEALIKMNIPFGYYIMGTYLEQGFGVKEDKEAAISYFRKAADLGNPEGQTAVGNIISDKLYRFQLARKFYACAVEQGSSDAAYKLALDYKTGSNRPENRYPPDYPMAAKYFQKAVEFGNEEVAFFMSQSFSTVNTPEDGFSYIGFDKADTERQRRYYLIGKEIDGSSSARFPDIDKVVPLPPAKLPPWDGTFEYKKELAKKVPPPPPPPEQPVPKAKPAPVAPAKPVSVVTPPAPLGTLCATGQICPETGYWEAVPPKEGLHSQASYFNKGDAMPTKQFILPRKFAWMDDVFQLRKDEFSVNWKLVSYSNTSQS